MPKFLLRSLSKTRWLFKDERGVRHGPHSLGSLVRLFTDDTLTSDCYVRAMSEEDKWQALKNFKRLYPRLKRKKLVNLKCGAGSIRRVSAVSAGLKVLDDSHSLHSVSVAESEETKKVASMESDKKSEEEEMIEERMSEDSLSLNEGSEASYMSRMSELAGRKVYMNDAFLTTGYVKVIGQADDPAPIEGPAYMGDNSWLDNSDEESKHSVSEDESDVASDLAEAGYQSQDDTDYGNQQRVGNSHLSVPHPDFASDSELSVNLSTEVTVARSVAPSIFSEESDGDNGSDVIEIPSVLRNKVAML